ncbi:FUSC family protein, partial [Nostoc sp. NIES-2111]
TLAGAIVGAAVAVSVPHASTPTLFLAVVAATAPLAFLAALKPSFRVAPVTALIMLLPSGAAMTDPWEAALYRVLEIGIGNVVGIAVALLVLPARAHGQARETAAAIADLNAELLSVLFDPGLTGEGRVGAAAVHARIRAALKQLETAAEEASRERRSHLTDQPDPEPLVRVLYRIRHDLVMIGRAAAVALPEALAARMAPFIAAVRDAARIRLGAISGALRTGGRVPEDTALDDAIRAYSSEIEAIRAEGTLRGQPAAVIGRFWSLPFAFEQLQQDLADLARLADGWASTRRAGGNAPPEPRA